MNFNERGDIPSCSALGRIRECPGSWALSRGVPDATSADAEKGQDVHDCLKQIVLGGLTNPQGEVEMLAWRLWDHIRNAAFNFYGDIELVWRAEERVWIASDNLEPMLSGKYDVLCYPKNRHNPDRAADEDYDDSCILFDAKTGWQSGDVPRASVNPQMQGMAELLRGGPAGNYIFGSIVREWAADEPELIQDTEWVWSLAQAVADGEYDIWHKAGLKTGPQCQFCPAKGNCPAYREAFSMVAVTPGTMTLETMAPQNLVRILRAAPLAADVIEAAKKEAHRRRLAGEELPGVIWAKGNQKRVIKDDSAILMRLKALGIEVPQKVEVKLSDVEKAFGKANDLKGKPLKEKFNKEFSEFLEFSENAPSIEFAE